MLKINSADAGQIEHMWCKIKSAVGEGMVTIGVIYRPPNISQDDNIKLNQLLECAVEITKKLSANRCMRFQLFTD